MSYFNKIVTVTCIFHFGFIWKRNNRRIFTYLFHIMIFYNESDSLLKSTNFDNKCIKKTIPVTPPTFTSLPWHGWTSKTPKNWRSTHWLTVQQVWRLQIGGLPQTHAWRQPPKNLSMHHYSPPLGVTCFWSFIHIKKRVRYLWYFFEKKFNQSGKGSAALWTSIFKNWFLMN